MTRLHLVLLALAALAAAAAAEPPRPRLIDFNPWAWIPTNRNRSPSIMDYFFPPSRTPKQSSLDPPADRQPPKTTTPIQTPLPTTIEERSTTLARKVSNKTKSTVPATNPTATAPPKTKKNSYKTTVPVTTTEMKTTQTATTIQNTKTSQHTKNTQTTKTELPTTRPTTLPTTYRSTKHYTIRPFVRTTEMPTVQDTETTSNSDSTETFSDFDTSGTTAEGPKETVPTLSTAAESRSTDPGTASTASVESTTETDSTAEPADSREGYLPLRDKPQPQTHVKINEQTKKETVPLPAGSTSVLAKPTKYHYYPHNQHIYLLPECAIQQVCNAVYVRLNYTQPLCACPARYRDPCSASLNADDLHTTRLTTDSKKKYAKKAVTLVKTCEAVSEMRECRAPRDWSLLALQNIRTGKSHYLVICRCPENHILEGPMSHDQPTYASVPGIRVYGMMCVRPTTAYHPAYSPNRYTATVQSSTSAYKVDYSQPHSYSDKPVYNRYPSPSYIDSSFYNRRSRVARVRRMAPEYPPFPWHKVKELARSLHWIN
ncbi:zonadhesin [Hyposmocoma kahamanoa]|uniref:zonadhesin n=1 Tax=Hyposmocoma kahamanoa TaxID=1477025 RepID=UPI000E6D6FEE|nr:zonadhesin [Hyposmocoma kahamanoa]